ncbi:MAG: tol-pal system-associated acyl-CoA thioesterase [Pseudomonadota bacterium]
MNDAMHTHAIRVYYEDTDLAGVVYYANYLRFIERGRTEALRDLGVDQTVLKARGIVFVVTQVNAKYLIPARFDDALEVHTNIDWVKRASCGMWQVVWRGREKLFTAEVTVACVGTDGNPLRLPTEVQEKLVQAHNVG